MIYDLCYWANRWEWINFILLAFKGPTIINSLMTFLNYADINIPKRYCHNIFSFLFFFYIDLPYQIIYQRIVTVNQDYLGFLNLDVVWLVYFSLWLHWLILSIYSLIFSYSNMNCYFYLILCSKTSCNAAYCWWEMHLGMML